MIKKYFAPLALLFATLLSLSAEAQDSKTILEGLSAKAKTFETVYGEYNYRLEDKRNDIDLSQDGKIWIKDKKFHIDLPDYTMVSDGETIWTYEKENNTCTIDYLEDVQDGGMDPSELFTIWETGFKHEWKGTEVVDGMEVEVIYLYPNDPTDKPYHTIQLYVDNNKKEIKKVVAKGKDGDDTTYSLKKFDPQAAISDSKFTFNQTNYPGVDMQDNRL